MPRPGSADPRLATVLATRMNELAYPESLRGEAQIILEPLDRSVSDRHRPFRIGVPRPDRVAQMHRRTAPHQSTVAFLGLHPKRQPRDIQEIAREHQEMALDYIVISHTLPRLCARLDGFISHRIRPRRDDPGEDDSYGGRHPWGLIAGCWSEWFLCAAGLFASCRSF